MRKFKTEEPKDFSKKKLKWNIEINVDSNPVIARIILDDKNGLWQGDGRDAKQLLQDVLEKWPGGVFAKYLITCGGFLEFPWPNSLPLVEDPKNPAREVVEILNENAEKTCREFLDEELTEKLKKRSRFLTLGIDSKNKNIRRSAELVAVIDLGKNQYQWTGKFYPTNGQKERLIRIAGLDTHFLSLGGDSVLVLGCHDLTVFNPRAHSTAKRDRKQWIETILQETKVRKPNIVLHHPHITNTYKTWNNGYRYLKREIKSITSFASAGKYENQKDTNGFLRKVLSKTKHGNTLDIVVKL